MKLSARITLALLSLRAGAPSLTEALLRSPSYVPAWPISPSIGRKIIRREFTFCGHSEQMNGTIRWLLPTADNLWHQEFLSYIWLQDVAAIQSDKIASSFAREFINAFTLLSPHDPVHACAWEPEVTGERLTHWLYYRHFVLRGGSDRFFARYQRALIRHVRVLYTQLCETPESLGPNALKGLIAAATIMPALSFLLPETMAALERLLERDVLADGGHISTSPNYHVSFLKTLIEIRDVLDAAGQRNTALQEAIARAGAWLQFLCHGDGRLGLFQENLMGDALILARVMELSYIHTPIRLIAPESGYAAMRSQRCCVLVRMCGQRPQPPVGVASFEFSEAEERIVVNCGAYTGAASAWKEAMRQPSAFSTLSTEGEDVPPAAVPVEHAILQAVEAEPHRLIAHVGYALADAVRHERHVELDESGTHVRGKDSILLAEGVVPAALPPMVARFHLHPDVRCQLQKDGGVMLTLVSGASWHFSCTHPQQVGITESVYLGYYGKPQKTLQIVVTIPVVKAVSSILWELKKQ
jgi:uncharacterized heparinase superfamily protein